MLKFVFFDLDRTLLPMDQDVYFKEYFKALSAKFAQFGLDPHAVVEVVYKGVYEMIKNDGSRYNAEIFWEFFYKAFPNAPKNCDLLLEDFYQNEYDLIKHICGKIDGLSDYLQEIKNLGLRIAVVSSPIYPLCAMRQRVKWAGIDPDMFEYYSTYENCHFTKPNPKLYLELANNFNLKPEEILMVGNDTEDDMSARDAGMQVFLLPQYLLNPKNKDISQYPNGSYQDLIKYIKERI